MTLSVLVAVTHLVGAGHLTRAAALARALAARGHRATLVSGGTPIAIADLTGIAFRQLPPVQARVGAFADLLDEAGRPVADALSELRIARLREAVAEARPDIVVTELYPFGRRVLAREFEALLAEAGDLSPRPLVVASIRDVLAPPSTHEKALRAHAILRRSYDAVLVHGDRRFIPLDASWPLAPDLAPLVHDVGYLDPVGPEQPALVPPSPGEILVSGGSSRAGLPLYRAAIEAAFRLPATRWRVLVGRGVAAAEREALAAAAPDNLVVEPARPDFRQILRGSAAFVGQAGYNTVMDLLATRTASLLCPFEEGGETEQRLRAQALARRGLAGLLPEAELTGETLAGRVAALLAAGPDAARPDLDLLRDDGRGAVALLERLAAARARPA